MKRAGTENIGLNMQQSLILVVLITGWSLF